MNVIHDKPGDIPDSTLILGIAWRLPQKCQVEGCKNKTAAIICMNEKESPTGSTINVCICEEHYQKGMQEGKLNEKFVL